MLDIRSYELKHGTLKYSKSEKREKELQRTERTYNIKNLFLILYAMEASSRLRVAFKVGR